MKYVYLVLFNWATEEDAGLDSYVYANYNDAVKKFKAIIAAEDHKIGIAFFQQSFHRAERTGIVVGGFLKIRHHQHAEGAVGAKAEGVLGGKNRHHEPPISNEYRFLYYDTKITECQAS